jgi:hypothetical protein
MLAVAVKKIPDRDGRSRCAFESWDLSTTYIFEDEKSFETVNIETVECWFLFLKLFFSGVLQIYCRTFEFCGISQQILGSYFSPPGKLFMMVYIYTKKMLLTGVSNLK